MRISALSPSEMARSDRWRRLARVAAVGWGRRSVEENTSKVYVGTGALASPAMNGSPGGGSPLFVINLCASIAPVPTTGKNLPGLNNYRLYQVARVEDGRTRHRLRLGFFTSESHAESVLAVVRQQYPTAFTACLCDEDRRFARGFLPDSALAAAAPPAKPPISVVPPPAAPIAAKAPVKPAASPAPAAAQKPPAPAASKTLIPAEPEVIELTWEPETSGKSPAAAATAAPVAAPSAAPVLSQDAGLDEFTWEPPSLQAPAASTSDTAKHPTLSPGYKTQPVIKAPAAEAKPAEPARKPATKAVAASPAAPAPAKPAAKIDTAASMRVPAIELSLSEPPPAPTPQATAPTTTPFHVGKGVKIADLGISLQAERSAAPAPAPETPAAKPTPATSKPTVAAAKSSAATPKPAPAKTPVVAKPPVVKAPPPAPKATSTPPTPAPVATAAPKAGPAIPPRNPMASLPDLDSTQTIRALTSAEMHDEAQEKWFAIQLAASEQPVNLDTMPHLDIFEAYRLYSVATAGSGKIIHSLRLGFFKEAVSAEAVSGYLNTFFGSPSVLRVSVAEHARFKDPPAPKKADTSKSKAEVVELSNARAARPVIPTVTEVATPRIDPSATGAFDASATGSFRASATGTHKTLKPAAKSAGATKRSKPMSSTGASGKHKALVKKSLSEQLLDEAREVELSESGIRRLPKNDSLLSRLVGKLTK
jgi:hypothetical protein